MQTALQRQLFAALIGANVGLVFGLMLAVIVGGLV